MPALGNGARPGIRPGGPYWPSLDGLRCFFIMLVFMYHVWPPWVPGGGIGVDGFFVLSAFLITLLLMRERARTGRIRLGRFYARRALRLLPALFVTVAVAAPLAYTLLPNLRDDVRASAQSALFYYANIRAAHTPTHMAIFLPTWSLSTEEQFYLVWPGVLLMILALSSSARVRVALLGGLVLAQVAWLQLSYERGTPLPAIYYRPDLRVTGILIGSLLGLAYSCDLLPSAARLLPSLRLVSGLGVGYIVAFSVHPQFMPARLISTGAIVIACVAWGALVLQQVVVPSPMLSHVLGNRIVMWLGRTSYVIYLVHVPIIRLTRHFLPALGPVPILLLAGPTTLVVTAAIHYGIERPALRYKDRRMEPPPNGATAA